MVSAIILGILPLGLTSPFGSLVLGQDDRRLERLRPFAICQLPIACFYAAAFCDAAGGSGCGRARASMAQTQNQLNSANKYAKRKRKTTNTSSPPKVEVLGSSLHCETIFPVQ